MQETHGKRSPKKSEKPAEEKALTEEDQSDEKDKGHFQLTEDTSCDFSQHFPSHCGQHYAQNPELIWRTCPQARGGGWPKGCWVKGGINLEGVSFLKVVQREADNAGDGDLAGGPTGVQSAWSPSASLPGKVGEGSAKRHPCWVQALCICSVGSLLRDENNQDPVLSRLNPQRDIPGREQSDSLASLGLGSSLWFWKLFLLHKELHVPSEAQD